eukprot:CAMPEP_0180552986 /NCGR_PEP_ID=MMETSP1036_2-20121128/74024_1 /TAXON_ID=632150 /ORGANISM="Azadinium spinosum, Strain 3D9" /LENGTH=68 /DNA_ID=CAMNT_0022568449 /DNA_START=195 /DNA_END=401 /DNA_ORIENTATION=-
MKIHTRARRRQPGIQPGVLNLGMATAIRTSHKESEATMSFTQAHSGKFRICMSAKKMPKAAPATVSLA